MLRSGLHYLGFRLPQLANIGFPLAYQCVSWTKASWFCALLWLISLSGLIRLKIKWAFDTLLQIFSRYWCSARLICEIEYLLRNTLIVACSALDPPTGIFRFLNGVRPLAMLTRSKTFQVGDLYLIFFLELVIFWACRLGVTLLRKQLQPLGLYGSYSRSVWAFYDFMYFLRVSILSFDSRASPYGLLVWVRLAVHFFKMLVFWCSPLPLLFAVFGIP